VKVRHVNEEPSVPQESIDDTGTYMYGISKYVMFVDGEISKIGAGNMSNLDQE
jgi:hypothetical protein